MPNTVNPLTPNALRDIQHYERQVVTLLNRLHGGDYRSRVMLLRELAVAQAKIQDTVSVAITGKTWAVYCDTIKGGYTPTVNADYHGADLATRFEYMFHQTFGRLAHLSHRSPSIVGAA